MMSFNTPFFSQEAEAQLIEKIGSMERSGVCLGYDPASATAAYVLVLVERGKRPVMRRWTVEGPVTLEHAREMTQEISKAAEADGMGGEAPAGMTIN